MSHRSNPERAAPPARAVPPPRAAARPAPAAPRRVWTAAEQAEQLSGYLEIPELYWDQVKYGTHVRYVSRAGGYRPGGFVANNPVEGRLAPGAPPGALPPRHMRMRNGYNPRAPGYLAWTVPYADIARLYVKPDASVSVAMGALEASVRGLNENIRRLAEHAKRLEARVAALEKPLGPRAA